MRSLSWLFVAVALCALAACSMAPRNNGAVSNSGAVASAEDPFATVARVLRHPRCLNCHTVTNFPRVGDQGLRHRMNVQRGPEDHGVPGMKCSTCHQESNQIASGVPGAPHWGLAPLSMGWEGLDDHDLAKTLIDRTKNGDRSLEDLVEHMEKDPLVGWAWDPGAGREAPQVSRQNFIAALEKWIEGGAKLPQKGVTSY